MSQLLSLVQLYRKFIENSDTITLFERMIGDFIEDVSVDSSSFAAVLQIPYPTHYKSVWGLVGEWQRTLILSLLLRELRLLDTYSPLLMERIISLSAIVVWDEFQLVTAYKAIVSLLLGQPVKKIKVIQSPSGSAPLEGGGHWSWACIPHPSFHAELGSLWDLYSVLSSDSSYLAAAEKLAQWQQHTLDVNHAPFIGLFSNEGDISEEGLLLRNYTLFSLVGRSSNRSDMAFLAEKQLEKLQDATFEDEGFFFPLATILEKIYALYGDIRTTFQLPSTFHDPDTTLLGYRSKKVSVVASLSGGGSGMGCFHFDDIQVVNFGPQHLPLGECLGFGLEGIPSDIQTSDSHDESSFSLRGIARLKSRIDSNAQHQSLANFREGEHAGIWLDTKIQFEKEKLAIDISLHHLFNPEIAFVFFVKSRFCTVDGKQKIYPRSFTHYQGDVARIDLHGNEEILTIEAKNPHEVHLVPLGGGKNFWGADFLIAYICSDKQKNYQWSIT